MINVVQLKQIIIILTSL